mmetsp:Transcript_15681/g.48538  ORF Transcript_15681/g.48538 Transcript_15681/m.48538 type:complete len:214 (-) Transcript_15681:1420-2061(-)
MRTKTSGGPTTAKTHSFTNVWSRVGWPADRPRSRKFAPGGGVPTTFVTEPRPSTRTSTVEPGFSHFPISRPQQPGTVPSPSTSPGWRPSPRAACCAYAAIPQHLCSAVVPAGPQRSPSTKTSALSPGASKSRPVSPGAQNSSHVTTSEPMAVQKLLHFTKPNPTDVISSAWTSLALKSFIKTKPPCSRTARAHSSSDGSSETVAPLISATSNS